MVGAEADDGSDQVDHMCTADRQLHRHSYPGIRGSMTELTPNVEPCTV
jgi:hypothetical protein